MHGSDGVTQDHLVMAMGAVEQVLRSTICPSWCQPTYIAFYNKPNRDGMLQHPPLFSCDCSLPTCEHSKWNALSNDLFSCCLTQLFPRVQSAICTTYSEWVVTFLNWLTGFVSQSFYRLVDLTSVSTCCIFADNVHLQYLNYIFKSVTFMLSEWTVPRWLRHCCVLFFVYYCSVVHILW